MTILSTLFIKYLEKKIQNAIKKLTQDLKQKNTIIFRKYVVEVSVLSTLFN